jgi:hypothetical protein
MSASFKKSVFAGLISAAFLAACGGGGSSTPTNSPPVGVSITPSNASGAVAYAYAGAQNLGSQSAVGSLLATAVSVQTPTNGLITASLQQLYKGLGALPTNNLATGVSASSTGTCSGGGTISVTVSEAVLGQISNGDGMSITASNCAESGVIENGTIQFTFNNITGTIASTQAWGATLALNFTNFSEQADSQTLSANGDLTLAYSQTANAASSTSTESGSSLQMNMTGNAGAVNRNLTAYNLTETVTSSTDSSFSANYTVTGSSPALGNTDFTVTTTTPFVTNGTTYPSVGSMTVTAADNSSATLTALDATNVQITVTTSGNGGTTQTIDTTWAALSSQM